MCPPCSLLCKPVTVEVRSGCSPGAVLSTLTGQLSIGLLDLVEAVFNRNSNTASVNGYHLSIDNVLPEYCEVRSSSSLLSFSC